MKILILNGSPRPDGNTAAMAKAFAKGAAESGHEVNLISVCQKNIGGCLACEYCHTRGNGRCIQQDDMQQIYPLLDRAEMIVLASPVYYHSFTGQLQCAINRIYALDKPKNLKKAALYCPPAAMMYTAEQFMSMKTLSCNICIWKIWVYLPLTEHRINLPKSWNSFIISEKT